MAKPRVKNWKYTHKQIPRGYVSQLSITITDTWDNQLTKRKGLFWLAVLEASVQDLSAPSLWACHGTQEQSKTTQLMARSQREEENGVPPPLQGQALSPWPGDAPQQSPVKGSSPANSAKLEDQAFRTWPFRDSQNSNYSRNWDNYFLCISHDQKPKEKDEPLNYQILNPLKKMKS